jgi:hypothetical protein
MGTDLSGDLLETGPSARFAAATPIAVGPGTYGARRDLPERPILPFTLAPIHRREVLRCKVVATKSPSVTGRQAMAHNFAINDDVHHQLQGPQGRAGVKQRSVYTIVTCLPIEADGRPRYRIKSKTENVERVVTEEQISRLG